MLTINQQIIDRIPNLTIPVAAYRPYRVSESLLYVSGQLPLVDGKPTVTGSVPHDVTEEQAQEAAVVCALNILGWVKHACGGDLSRVKQCIRLGGFVVTANGYANAPAIINAASGVMTEVFGKNGEHARVAMGVASLPMNVPVEVEALFEIEPAEV